MEGIEAVCFQIISFAGSAKSCYMEAIGAAEQDDYDKAKALMAEGDSCFHEGHRIHAQLITKEANQEKIDIRLLLIHAEDQMTAAETVQILAEKFIHLHERMYRIEGA